jgi:hypothetical protein
MRNSDGTLAKDKLAGFIPVSFSNGSAVIQFVVTDGDAKVIAEASPEELKTFLEYATATLVDQIKAEVAKQT